MNPNQIAGTFDVAQLAMIVFIGGVLGLFVYLRREDKREGYPLEDPASPFKITRPLVGFPLPPPPKLFRLMHGGTATMPHPEGRTDLPLVPHAPFPGAPFTPTGDPMQDGVGPASFALKNDEPLLTWEGHPQLQPLRILPGWDVIPGDPDPRGMTVLDADGVAVGTVTDLWLDHGVQILRYLEVSLPYPDAPRAMIPIYFADISSGARLVRVPALFARHFAAFPQLQAHDTITAREEDRVASYCQGGLFYGDARRSESLL